ncbi:hypothetical protein BS78_05G275700 [Paspalum vaginatum]|nr:hypothetical protein BS78_05G275700 [Paspalum vaginatum]
MAATLVEEKDESAEKMQKEPPEEMDKAAAAAAYVWLPVVEAWYEHCKKLGKGMLGNVYKAWDHESKRLVAVKQLSGRTEGSHMKMGLHDLAREGMSLAVCRDHRSVVQLVATHADSSRGNGDNFLVTRYAGSVNLRRYMRSGAPSVLWQLLADVERMYGAGIMHMDITPENAIVDKARNARVRYRICGFGMSKPAASSRYRAPELFMKYRGYNGRVDTWGLGCIMAELFDDMMRIIRTKGIVDWPGLQRLLWTTHDRVDRLPVHGYGEYTGCLRQRFPEEVLSEAGFQVLSGLLEPQPEAQAHRRGCAPEAVVQRRPFGRCCFVP